MIEYKSMATPIMTNLKKLSDVASDSNLVDPTIMTNLKKLSDSASDLDLVMYRQLIRSLMRYLLCDEYPEPSYG